MRIVIIANSSSLKSGSTGMSYIENFYKAFSQNHYNVLVQCPEDALPEISKIVPQYKIMTEPVSRGTAASIGLAVAHIANENPEELVMFIFANQDIKYQERLLRTLNIIEKIYENLGKMILIGVPITHETDAYGYIEVGKVLMEMSGVVTFAMQNFERKPSKAKVQHFMKSWKYLWDTGCMISSAENLLEIYKNTMFDMFTGLMTIKASIGTRFEKEIVNSVYPTFQNIPMSKGIYEKIAKDQVIVIPVDMGINKQFTL